MNKNSQNKSTLALSNKSKFAYNFPLLLLSLPAIIYLILFHYLPIFGIVLAFKDYNYVQGILGSPWAGFKYFQYFFESNGAFIVIRNTLLYNLLFIFLKQALCVLVALFLYEMTNRLTIKAYQTLIILPNFISWVLVAYIGFALFSSDSGILNSILEKMGRETINWYGEPKYWPYILTTFEMWKTVGMGSILYYAALMGIDDSLFEAARLDGANRIQQVFYISLPSILPVISILLIMAMGGIMSGDFGLFYQVPRNSGALYSTTDTINTYVFRALQSGNMSQSAAVGLFQSLVGLVLVLTTNGVVRKISPESSMF